MLANSAHEMLMASHQFVHIGDLESGVIEARFAGADEKERVVIDMDRPAIATHESAKRHIGRKRDFVRRDETKAALVPGFALAKIRDVQHAMPQTLHLRRTGREA